MTSVASCHRCLNSWYCDNDLTFFKKPRFFQPLPTPDDYCYKIYGSCQGQVIEVRLGRRVSCKLVVVGVVNCAVDKMWSDLALKYVISSFFEITAERIDAGCRKIECVGSLVVEPAVAAISSSTSAAMGAGRSEALVVTRRTSVSSSRSSSGYQSEVTDEVDGHAWTQYHSRQSHT